MVHKVLIKVRDKGKENAKSPRFTLSIDQCVSTVKGDWLALMEREAS
jgi:hypothetical protein